MDVVMLGRRMLSPIKQHYLLSKHQVKWRAKNKHNMTSAGNIFPIEKVSVGKYTYGELNVYSFGGDVEGLAIGHFCSIAGNVVFLLGGEHPMDRVSTFPFARMVYGMPEAFGDGGTKGKIVVGDDVWIGNDVCILSGVHVGQGAVIGAGSVVTKDIPPYAVFVGNRIIRYRFSDTIIRELLKINYGTLNEEQLAAYQEFCNTSVTEENVSKMVELFV